MRSYDEFKEEVLRRAEAGRREQARRRRRIRSLLSTAACFALIVGVLLGTGPLLRLMNTQEDMVNPPYHETPATTGGTNSPVTGAPNTESTTVKVEFTASASVTETTNAALTSTVLATSTTDGPRESDDSVFRLLERITVTPRVLPEETTLLHLLELEDFERSPYYVEGVLTEGDFEGKAIYLLLTPCPTGLISAKLTAEDGVTYAYSLYANLSQGDTPYCAYILICNRPFVKIECVPQ